MIKDQVALVTGGNAGIGKAIVKKFLDNGAKVAIFGTNEERGQAVVEELVSIYGKSDCVKFYSVDVSKTDQVVAAIRVVEDDFGSIDILVNNAGITKDTLLMKMKEEQWDDVVDVNLKSVYNTCHVLVRSMMKARKGKIINISSVIGLTGNAGQVNYAASKSGMIGFAKALAKEVATRGICVNCIAPGFIETDMTDKLSVEQRKWILDNIPSKKLGKPEDVAKVALFLASDMSDYITGQVITVDGGMVM